MVSARGAILLLLRALPVLGVSLYGTPFIILLAYFARFLPLPLMPVMAALDRMDPVVEDAASLCGAGLRARLRHVVLPMIAPAAAAVGLLVFLIPFHALTGSALL